MKISLIITSLLLSSLAYGQRDSLNAYYQMSKDAYEASKFEAYLKFIKRANEIRPNHPILTYNLASAYAVNQQPDKAVDALKHYLKMNASSDYLKDSDFDAIKDFKPFTELEQYLEDLTKPISNSKIAFTINQKEQHFESITYHPKRKTFYFGTVNTRKIIAYQDGKTREVYSASDLYSVMGLDVDLKNGRLWVCSAALTQMNKYQDTLKNQSTVMVLDLETFKVLAQYKVSNALFGDVIADQNGGAFVTDGLNNKVYHADLKKVSVLADVNETFYNLQGIALFDQSIILSDYITGLYSYHLKTGKLMLFPKSDEYASKGIDGILATQDKVICFQNGTNPKRVFQLSNRSTLQIVDQMTNRMGEPTQGVLVGNAVYFISNSAWHAYDKENNYQSEVAEDLEVRVFNLSH